MKTATPVLPPVAPSPPLSPIPNIQEPQVNHSDDPVQPYNHDVRRGPHLNVQNDVHHQPTHGQSDDRDQVPQVLQQDQGDARVHVPLAPHPTNRRNIPPHLRERWILAKDPSSPPIQYSAPIQYLPPVQYSPYSPTSPVQVQPTISPIFPTPIQPDPLAPFHGYTPYQQYQTSPYSMYMNTFPQTYSSYSTNQSQVSSEGRGLR